MWFWRLRSPTVFCLHVRDLGKLAVRFQSEPNSLRTGGACGVSPSAEARKSELRKVTRKREGGIPPFSTFLFCLALKGLDDAPPTLRGRSTLLSPPTQC